jgi:glycerol-3-phosphate dehydrogenase (NAD+)
MSKKRVAIVGSGNWACAIAKIVGANCQRDVSFEDDVRMWVFEEMVEGRKLTDIINTEHENVKYMRGIKLPSNIIADPDIVSATKGANILIFVLPHQFLGGLCKKIAGNHAPECIAISLIKAVHFDESGMVLISDIIKKGLGGMDVSVLMGANLAVEVARGAFCETTIGYRIEENGAILKKIFDDPLFHTSIVNDVPGVEVCGALKNVSFQQLMSALEANKKLLNCRWLPWARALWTEWN